MEKMPVLFVTVYLVTPVIACARVSFFYYQLYFYMKRNCPQRLSQFGLVPGYIFGPFRFIKALYQRHNGTEDPKLLRLIVKIRNTMTFVLLWLIIGFFVLFCLVTLFRLPYIFQ